jgi:hypothetical protein
MAPQNKKAKRGLREFRSVDGTPWRVAVRSPGSSNAMVVFHHPAGGTSRRDRYAWHLTSGPEARNVTARLKPEEVLESLTDEDLALLYRRSMPISTPVPIPESGKGT